MRRSRPFCGDERLTTEARLVEMGRLAVCAQCAEEVCAEEVCAEEVCAEEVCAEEVCAEENCAEEIDESSASHRRMKDHSRLVSKRVKAESKWRREF